MKIARVSVFLALAAALLTTTGLSALKAGEKGAKTAAKAKDVKKATKKANKKAKKNKSTVAVAAEGQLNAAPAGFTPLFNGKNLDGWKGLVGNPISRSKMTAAELKAAQAKADERMKAHWKVVDGVLVFDGKGDNLCTVKDYGNFELLVDWKIEKGGDSGIYLRGSPQIQIWDTEFPAYFRHGAEKGSGALWNNAKNPRFPSSKADKPAGQWNTLHIKMVGEKVTVKLNGVLVVDNVTMENLWDRTKPIFPTGSIELQNHGNTLYFRNIYVKELPPTKTASETKTEKKVEKKTEKTTK